MMNFEREAEGHGDRRGGVGKLIIYRGMCIKIQFKCTYQITARVWLSVCVCVWLFGRNWKYVSQAFPARLLIINKRKIMCELALDFHDTFNKGTGLFVKGSEGKGSINLTYLCSRSVESSACLSFICVHVAEKWGVFFEWCLLNYIQIQVGVLRLFVLEFKFHTF